MNNKQLFFIILNIFVIQLCLSYIFYEYYVAVHDECTRDPLIFGVKEMQKDYRLPKLDCQCSYWDMYFNFKEDGYYLKEIEVNSSEMYQTTNFTELFLNALVK